MASWKKGCILIASLAIILQSRQASCTEEGALRLHGGIFDYQGLLQIFRTNSWGVICADLWDFKDADVVCRELGYPGAALSAAPFHIAPPHGDFWLTEVECDGDEASLLDCDHTSWETVARSECIDGVVKIQCRVSNYLGCLDVIQGSPVMEGRIDEGQMNLTVVKCIETCRRDGFALAAVQAPTTCTCGTHGHEPSFEGGAHIEKCNTTCPGDGNQVCGGAMSASVYDVVQGGCGGTLSGRNVSITSPGFPGGYPAGYTCRWEVRLPDNSYTTIRLPVFEVKGSDELVIEYNGQRIRLGMGDSFEDRVDEGMSNVMVTFRSTSGSTSGSTRRGGFMLTFTDDSYCPNVELTNGTMVVEEGMKYRPGDRVEVDCVSEFMPYRRWTTCTAQGDWQPEPACVPYNKWTSWEFRRTVLFIAVIAVCVLFLMFMLTICYLLCGDTKKKNEGRYYGINTDSGEPHGGETSPTKEEYKAVGMEDAGDIDEEGRDAGIPLATEVDV